MSASTCPVCGDVIDDLLDVCHSCTGALVIWLQPRVIRSRWRSRARNTMVDVVKAYRRANSRIDPDALIKLVDDAYPFGERAMAPYKAWLHERKTLLAVLRPEPEPPAPTAEDFAACEVAIDLVETGREDEARRLLDEQAPRRLNRACKACGAKAGKACRWMETEDKPRIVSGAAIVTMTFPPPQKSDDRIVPHLVRVGQPKRPAPMPLFERSAP